MQLALSCSFQRRPDESGPTGNKRRVHLMCFLKIAHQENQSTVVQHCDRKSLSLFSKERKLMMFRLNDSRFARILKRRAHLGRERME